MQVQTFLVYTKTKQLLFVPNDPISKLIIPNATNKKIGRNSRKPVGQHKMALWIRQCAIYSASTYRQHDCHKEKSIENLAFIVNAELSLHKLHFTLQELSNGKANNSL